MKDRVATIIDLFKQNNSILKTSELIGFGVSKYEISKLQKNHIIESFSRGIYKLSSIPYSTDDDYTIIQLRVKNSVLCLISALIFHNLTLQIPGIVDLAIPINSYKPKISYPPVQYITYSEEFLNTGVITIKKPGCNFKVFDREKSIIDCLVLKHLLWQEVIADAFRSYLSYPEDSNMNKLEKYAKQFGVLEDVSYWMKEWPQHCNK